MGVRYGWDRYTRRKPWKIEKVLRWWVYEWDTHRYYPVAVFDTGDQALAAFASGKHQPKGRP